MVAPAKLCLPFLLVGLIPLSPSGGSHPCTSPSLAASSDAAALLLVAAAAAAAAAAANATVIMHSSLITGTAAAASNATVTHHKRMHTQLSYSCCCCCNILPADRRWCPTCSSQEPRSLCLCAALPAAGASATAAATRRAKSALASGTCAGDVTGIRHSTGEASGIGHFAGEAWCTCQKSRARCPKRCISAPTKPQYKALGFVVHACAVWVHALCAHLHTGARFACSDMCWCALPSCCVREFAYSCVCMCVCLLLFAVLVCLALHAGAYSVCSPFVLYIPGCTLNSHLSLLSYSLNFLLSTMLALLLPQALPCAPLTLSHARSLVPLIPHTLPCK